MRWYSEMPWYARRGFWNYIVGLVVYIALVALSAVFRH